jgi:hypothetical protein
MKLTTLNGKKIKYSHPFRRMKINGKMEIIDKRIYNLIRELTKIGIKTKFSCEGDKEQIPYLLIDIKNISTQLNFMDNTLSIYWKRKNTPKMESRYTVVDKKGNFKVAYKMNTKTKKLILIKELLSGNIIYGKGGVGWW